VPQRLRVPDLRCWACKLLPRPIHRRWERYQSSDRRGCRGGWQGRRPRHRGVNSWRLTRRLGFRPVLWYETRQSPANFLGYNRNIWKFEGRLIVILLKLR